MGRRTRAQIAAQQKNRAATKARGDAAAKAASAQGSAVNNYTGTNVDKARATATFDKAKSQRLREAASQKVAATQGRRGRAASRARDLQRVHGRTDEQKIQSQATGSRNARVAKDALTTFIPGGAGAGAIAKAQKAKKAVKLAQQGLKTASKLGAGSIKKGIQKGAGVAANRIRQAGVKGVAAKAGKLGKQVGKYKAKVTAQGQAHAAAFSG